MLSPNLSFVPKLSLKLRGVGILTSSWDSSMGVFEDLLVFRIDTMVFWLVVDVYWSGCVCRNISW